MASLVRISSAYIKESDNGTNLIFTVSLDQANPTEAVTVEVSTVGDTAETGSDFTAVSNQTITFDPGTATQTIAIPIVGDTIYERTETFFVQLANPSTNATIDSAQAQAVGTILNDDAIPTLSIADVEFSEDQANAVLTVTRTGQTTEIVTVGYTTADDDAKTGSGDYTITSGTLVFLADETTKKITVPLLEDTLSEANEKFLVQLSAAKNATIAKAEGTVTITDNDPIPSLSISSVTIAETAGGTNAVFTVTLSPTSGQTVTVNYATADNTALAGQDYTTTLGTLTFAPGTTTQQITVPILDDTKFEPEESFFVNLSDAIGASITQGKGTATVTDSDPKEVIVSIGDVTVTEGDSGTTIASFTVSLSDASSQNISVDYALAHGTTSPNDAALTSGTLQFAVGQTEKTIEVTINGDLADEGNETFSVNLSNPTNAVIGDGQGAGEITDNDGVPTISIDDISVTEGNSGTITATLTVSLSNGTDQVVEVDFATSDGTASETAGDYAANSGKLTFQSGELSKQIDITVNGDQLSENNETLLVTLTNAVNATLGDAQGKVTLENDDAPPTLPKISISDVRRITEGDSGTVIATFTVSLSAPEAQPVTVDYETTEGTATTADSDYVSTKGQLTFAPRVVKQSIEVTINGDTNIEANETIFVNLSNASANATIARVKATGTIINDDVAPTISIGDITFKEGNSGTTEAVFQVSLNKAYSSPVTVDYKTLDETATTADKEYVAAAGTLTFNSDQTSQTITVLVNGDSQLESDETFLLALSNATNGTIVDDRAIATIQNDDTGTDPNPNTPPPALPTLSITDTRLQEGNSGTTNATFTLSLSAASSESVTVNYATADETATAADGDYTAVSLATVTFAPGETSQTITIAIKGDTTVESDETFRLNLTNPQNAEIAQGSATATITNDDIQSNPTDGSANPGSGSNSGPQPLVLSGTPNVDRLIGGDGDDTIYGLEGDDVLNGGAGNDLVHGGTGNDTLYGSAGIDQLVGAKGGDQLWGGDGDDVIYGGKGHDRLYGENGNDKIYGKAGNDRLSGGEGDDLLVGNLGVDRLLGGAGKDQFGFRKHKDKSDRIVDFSVPDDTILIDRLEFKAGLKLGSLNTNQFQLGKQATDAADRFIYNRSTGALYFDKDGARGSAQLQIAQLSKNLTLSHQDIVIGVNI